MFDGNHYHCDAECGNAPDWRVCDKRAVVSIRTASGTSLHYCKRHANHADVVKAMKHNIGGSLLPSSDSRILQPLGNYRVVQVPVLDTHVLLWRDTIVAAHPNGYSCRELAERMTANNVAHALQQHAYILACGGTALSAECVTNIMAKDHD